MSEILIRKIKNNEEVVGVVGLGYVGLPLALAFVDCSLNVIGFDTSEDKVLKINNGENYISDVRDKTLKEAINSKKLKATNDFSLIKECDIILICVPTPLDKFLKPDMTYIESACEIISKHMTDNTFVCLESTTYPTTTEHVVLPIIQNNSNLIEGEDFWLAYSPERVDPGNSNFNTKNTPKVLGALNPLGLEIGTLLYEKAITTIHSVSSPRAAEMVKILENTYRLVNISLINELALLSGKMDINIWEVIDAAGTKPFGFQAFYPGPGIGGHCIPLDPFYLEHIAKKYEFDLSMIHTAGHINMRMPHYMYIKISTALNTKGKAIKGSKILIIGVAYKANINDARESPAVKIINKLLHKGALAEYHDPHISELQIANGGVLFSTEISPELLSTFDAVVICTNHDEMDKEMIKIYSNLIIDLRNTFPLSDKIHKL